MSLTAFASGLAVLRRFECWLLCSNMVPSEATALLLLHAGASFLAVDESECMGRQWREVPHVLQLLPLG